MSGPGALNREKSTALDRPHRRDESRAVIARRRARLAYEALADCHLCSRHCGVNRIAGERGYCQAGAEARAFSAQTGVADELDLIPTFAVAFSGCDLRCAFCITAKESWNPEAGEPADAAELASRAVQALGRGARSIMILGGEPTVHLPAALDLVARLPDDARLVWKTDAHGSEDARALLDGLFDVWVADYKFGNNACAERLARVSRYTEVVQENLLWANRHSDLVVRHLIMPGHTTCCWRPVAAWLAKNLPGVKVSLRGGFWPAWQSSRVELRGAVSPSEAALARAIGADYNLNLIE